MTTSIKLRPVTKGDEFILEVEGGVVRRKAPEDGVIVESHDRETFLPESKVREALAHLEARRVHAGVRKAPQRAEQLSLTPEKKRKAV